MGNKEIKETAAMGKHRNRTSKAVDKIAVVPVSRSVCKYDPKTPDKSSATGKPNTSSVVHLKAELSKCQELIQSMQKQLHQVQVHSFEPTITKVAGDALACALEVDQKEIDAKFFTRPKDYENWIALKVDFILNALGDRSPKFLVQMDRLINVSDVTTYQNREEVLARVKDCLTTFEENKHLKEDLTVQYRVLHGFQRKLCKLVD